MDNSEVTRANKQAETRLGMSAWSLVVFWLAVQSLSVLSANAGDYYVASGGADTNPGTLEEPFATLERARNAIRQLKKTDGLPKDGVVVELLGGVYELAAPLKLLQEDSGEEGSPIVYRARQGEQVRLLGGRVVTGWQPVADPEVLDRLDSSARGKVFQADLKAQGITEYPSIEAPGWAHSDPGVELFYRGTRMTLARWPNEGYTKIVDLVVQDGYNIRGRKGSRVGKFVYEGDRPERWLDEKEAWLHGYWWVDWAEQRMRVQEIDAGKKQITLAPKPTHQFGFRKGQWYYALNLLCELDRPGEWYLDRDAGVLYFWPSDSIREGDTMISSTKGLATLEEASHVILAGLTLEAGRRTAVTVTGGEKCTVVGCVIRNMGGWGVRVTGGNGHRVAGCDLYDLGEGGIWLSGGDRRTLTPADHVAENNHIHHCSRWNPVYNPGIALRGVGQRASHNLLHDLPHIAIGFTENEHCIEYNEMHNVVYQSNDAGAIYTYGPSETWTMRGHVIRYNYLHDINGFEGRGCRGVYLDDCFSSAHIYGNQFERVNKWAVFIGGGRDSIVEKNLFVDCGTAVHIDARGLGWAAHIEPHLKDDLTSFPFTVPPWSTRYPQLLTLLENNPMTPVGNVIRSNVSVGGNWDSICDAAKKHGVIENNLIDEDPHFVDAAKGDYRLRPDSPAFALGFEPIPCEKIGCYQSPERASWPIHHAVWPADAPPSESK